MEFIRNWFKDAFLVCCHELKKIFGDSGVMIIVTVAGLGYPLLYNCIYHNGILEETPIAVVDDSDCEASRRFIRKVDATRELCVMCKCATMEEAESLMKSRKVNGVMYFPHDFGERIAGGKTAILSIYADMSSFLYYKNLLLGTNFVMLDDMKHIQVERYSAGGMSDQQVSQLITAIPYEENNPYNRTFSYTIFFLSAALILIIQQVMFYGMCMRVGTAREEGRNFTRLLNRMSGPGVGRVVLGRGAAYWLLFMAIGIYIACLVPAIFQLPQRGNFFEILVLLMFYVTDCVFFSTTCSSFFTRRETVMVLLLFISPIALFLTGFSWPVTAFPAFWKYFSYLFPSTFACQAFINMNTAGGDLLTVHNLMVCLVVQTSVYCLTSFIAAYVEYRRVYNEPEPMAAWVEKWRPRIQELEEKRKQLEEKRRQQFQDLLKRVEDNIRK